MWNKIQRIYIGDHYQVYPKWKPWANTMGYYTFDDQNASQITDTSWNNRNLTWGAMPSYTLVSGSNYAGNYANTSSSAWQKYSYGSMNGDYTILLWVKPTATWSCYLTTFDSNLTNNNHQISIIYGYNSWQFEYYDDLQSSTLKRIVIKSWATVNNWYLIGYTRNWTAVKTYQNGEASNTITWSNSTLTKYLFMWSSRSWDRLKWQIWECIVENRVWTAQEIADYYNQTKSSYLWFN